MRFLLTILIWFIFVGGLWAYTAQRDASLPGGPAQVAAPKALTGSFVLEITPGFSIEKDPFALALEDDVSQTRGLEVRLNGRQVRVDADKIQRGRVIRITKNLTFSQGGNELYVKASPPMAETNLDHGLRVRLLDRGNPVVDQTIWSSAGAVVAGTVSFSLSAVREAGHE